MFGAFCSNVSTESGSDVELIEMYQGGAGDGFHSPLARRLLY